jgi:phage anti-repressor protein
MKTNDKVLKAEKELIPVVQGELGLEVSSRMLHKRLEVQTPHRIWIERRIKEAGFDEGLDFRTNLYESTGGRRAMERKLTLDMAKEIAMMEKTPIGKAVRRYFIEIEKRYRDWTGFIFPQLKRVKTLFEEGYYFDYTELLLSCGCSVKSGSKSRRIRKNPQEFSKDQHGNRLVSENYGKTIVVNAIARKLNAGITQRRLPVNTVSYQV